MSIQGPNKTETGLGEKPLYFKNVGLFSENYIQNHLDKSKDPFVMRAWQTEDLPAFGQLAEWMHGTWTEMRDQLEKMSEAQLEQEWIRPILDRLGWHYVVQPDATRHGRRQVPDYALFEDESSKRRAMRIEGLEQFKIASVVADAKAMEVDLDGKALDNTNPSFQIMQYLTVTNRDWGILTNGRYWRIYSLKSKTKYRSYFEINVEKFLNGPTPELGRFKLFFNFFCRNAFAEKNAAGQSFVDIVFNEGVQYAQEVEVQLKHRAFELVELIANGFYQSGNFKDEDLDKLYNHSLYYLFRLIFVLNCEAKGLLNISRQGHFFKYSLRSLCGQIKDEAVANQKWSSQPRSYNYIRDLFNLIAKGDSDVGVHGFGEEIFSSGERRFFDSYAIYDKYLNDVLLKLACQFDKKRKEWAFIDYQRLSIDHMGSLFEGLLEFKLEREKSGVALVNTNGERTVTGSFYTPDYIVDYIVSETIGPQVEGKTNSEILKMKFVDPAMGSGHFLLGIVKFVEDKILENLNSGDNSISKFNPVDARWLVLHNCVFGCDINPLAKELAKFSLWMFSATNVHRLEPLDDQLICADSLKIEKTWGKLFSGVKFQAVVGNPPYVRQEYLKVQKDLLESEFEVFHAMADLYSYFIELSARISDKQGRIGLIVGNKWMRAEYGAKLREWILQNGIEKIVDFGDLPVFKGIAAYPCILYFGKSATKKPTFAYSLLKSLDFSSVSSAAEAIEFPVKRSSLSASSWAISDPAESKLSQKLESGSVPLSKYVAGSEFYGIKTGCGDAFVVDKETADALIKSDPKSREVIRPFAAGREIQPYSAIKPKKYVLLMRRGIDIKKYPAVEKHLLKFKDRLMPRPKDWKGEWKGRKPGSYKWYELQDAVDYIGEFDKPKIMFLAFQVRPAFTLDYNKTLANNAVWCVAKEDYFLLALLNSKIGWFLISKNCTQIRGGYQLIFKYLGKVPVKTAVTAAEKKLEQAIVTKSKLASKAKGKQLDIIKSEIDDLLYRFYGLSESESELVEKAAPKASTRASNLGEDESKDAA